LVLDAEDEIIIWWLTSKERRQRRKDHIAAIKRNCIQLRKEHEGSLHRIDLLHKYNDAKDTGQMLFGKLAEFEGVQTKNMYKKYGMELDD